MKFYFSLVLALALSGCLSKKMGTRADLGSVQELEVRNQCAQMRAIGGYLDLKLDFDQRIRRLLKLADRDPRVTRSQIETELIAIENDVARIKQLSQPEWSSSSINATYVWRISAHDLASERIAISGVELMSVKAYGKSLDSSPGLALSHDADSVSINWTVPSSPLEVCELPTSLAVIIRVRFEDDAGPESMDFALLAPQVVF